MRAFPTICLSVAMGLLSVTASSAQFADPRVALAGRDGAMTCGMFAHLSPHHRDAIVRGLNISAPPQSLATPMVTPNVHARRGGGHVTITTGSSMLAAPLTAGVLVAACEAVTPGESLRSAYGQFDSRNQGMLYRHR